MKETHQFRHEAPVEYMYCHGLELLLKGGLIHFGKCAGKVLERGHKILLLYDDAKCQEGFSEVISSIEAKVRDDWKTHLRQSRDKIKEPLEGLGIKNTEELKDFGVHDNAVIGNALPALRDQIVWLDDRHAKDGGLFRYPKERLDNRPTIVAFGLNEDVILRTVSLASRLLCDRLIYAMTAPKKV